MLPVAWRGGGQRRSRPRSHDAGSKLEYNASHSQSSTWFPNAPLRVLNSFGKSRILPCRDRVTCTTHFDTQSNGASGAAVELAVTIGELSYEKILSVGFFELAILT